MNNFSHFRVKSEYSLTNSIVKIDALVKSGIERNINAIALTDNSNLFGLVKFYTASIKNGIKPLYPNIFARLSFVLYCLVVMFFKLCIHHFS